jgi:hypothetical protein
VPLDAETLSNAFRHLERRGLITIRAFPESLDRNALPETTPACALTAKAVRALAPKTWGDVYG